MGTLDSGIIQPPSLRGHRDLRGHGPHTRDQLTGNRDHDLSGVFPPCAELPIAFAQPDLCLPTRVLDRRGEFFQAALQVPTHLGRIAVRPGPFDQRPTGMGIASLREAALASALATGICRWRQAQIIHELSRVIEAGQVAELSDGGDRHRQLHTTEGLERVNHRAEPPGGAPLVEFLGKTLEPVGVLGDCPDLCLEDDWLGWGGTDDLAEPAQVRRAPGGPTGIPDIMPQQKGFQAKLGRLEIVERLFTRPTEVTNGFVCDRWDIDRREIPRAHQPRQLDRITTVGFHAVAGLFGNQGGGDDPAELTFFHAIPVAPVAARSRFVDEDQMFGFGLQLAHEVINVTWAGADGPAVGDLSAGLFRDVSDGNRVFVDIQSDVTRARLAHG